MSGSPIEELLSAIDVLDLDRTLALLAPECTFLMADGHAGAGHEALGEALGELFAHLHRVEHRISAQWHVDEVWIAELEADYELTDRSRLLALPRALILRKEEQGISDLRVYGAHEREIYERDLAPGGLVIGGRYMPPL